MLFTEFELKAVEDQRRRDAESRRIASKARDATQPVTEASAGLDDVREPRRTPRGWLRPRTG